jgi:hypothetical protein
VSPSTTLSENTPTFVVDPPPPPPPQAETTAAQAKAIPKKRAECCIVDSLVELEGILREMRRGVGGEKNTSYF